MYHIIFRDQVWSDIPYDLSEFHFYVFGEVTFFFHYLFIYLFILVVFVIH